MESSESTSVISTSVPEVDEIKQSCRVCMAKKVNMSRIFDTESNLIAQIEFCTGIQLTKEDDLPSQICNVCITDLSVAHKFKTRYIHADNMFRKLLANVKIEASDDETNNESYNINDDDVKEETLDNQIGDEAIKSDVKVMTNVDKSKIVIQNIPQVRKTRGPYRKSEQPKRLRKYKFKRLQCEPCGIKFASRELSDEHKRNIHKENESWVCEICGKMFIHRASLYTHTRSHLPPQYGCEKCDYRTWHKHDLVKHLRIHTGEKQYQCHFCTSSYHTSSNLTGHIRRFHEGLKRFQCHLCDRKFFDRTKLNRHVDSHNEIRRFECDICHSFFTRRCYWKKHLHRQHNVEIPPQRPGRRPTWSAEKLVTTPQEPTDPS
ncbi:zinc finger and SCAN domain-containing protein 21-like [Achroia grisella]|uniref:zinc finger and SCAN domain-containing protein 21-like n=1 Tax=Achroia grisella TaxID=688607 RepID=UPI0027D1F410|nr:zinc finger and SCAN domain-containing protein 21-like [Achroia grisella]